SKPDAELTVVKAETKQSGIEAVSEDSRTPSEVSYSVKGAAKAQTESENGNADTAGSEKSFEVFRGAAEKGEISAPEVRTVTREVPVKAEQTEEKPELVQSVQTARVEQPEEQSRTQRTEDSRTTSVTEELEMLKNAKNKSAQTQEKPAVSTESPLTADAPITLTRANGERVEVRPSEIIEQATAKLVETAQTMKEQATEYSLVLNPEELGKIVVKLVKAADGAVSVSIAAENTRTQRILEQHSAAMQENLRDSGVKLEGWQMVRESEQETYAHDYNGSSKNPYYREENHSHSESESEETSFAYLIASM
ncbi:MAG: flagellar hook-length control protein FliK, partial [Oscillospiraceae bacterium]|nr:flagellar hook-length control protein FliK [Oscillospiraceae bacterium]